MSTHAAGHRFIPSTSIAALVAMALAAAPGHAAAPPPARKAPAATSPGLSGGMALPGLPAFQMPAQYSVDLVMSHEGKSMTMKRSIDGPRMRSEITSEGRQIIMLERPEDGGAIYTLMPSEKMAMKMSPQEMAPATEREVAEPAPPKIEKLGVENLEGRSALKYRVTSEGHAALAWFDAASGAPIKMEAEGATVEWKNLKPGPQPAKLFELPKDYQVMDMDEQMKQMRKMTAGMPGGASGAMSQAMRGMGGGGMSGMAGGMGSQFGADMGQSLGSGIGASLGGPLGAMAGGYIGGRVGGWLGRKTADAITPGPPSR